MRFTQMSSAVSHPENPQANLYAGVLFALGAVSIWSAWMAITRLGVKTSLTALDITMLRFLVAGLLLLPVVVKKGLAFDRLGGFGLLVLISGAGAPYALVAASGLVYAPAAHAGTLIPGAMPLFVAVILALLLKERFSVQKKLGYGLIFSGLLSVVGYSALIAEDGYLLGHLLFVLAAFMWACYTYVLRRSGLEPLHATAILALGSLLMLAPFYLWYSGLAFTKAPIEELVAHALFQGVLSTMVALYFYAKAVSILGTARGASFAALVPGFAALFAIPILGEWPSLIDWLGIAAVTLGVYLAGGGGLPRWKKRQG